MKPGCFVFLAEVALFGEPTELEQSSTSRCVSGFAWYNTIQYSIA